MDTFFIIIGLAVAVWFMFGFLYVLFFMQVSMPPGEWHPPLVVKAMSVIAASFHIPFVLLFHGVLPTGMAIVRSDMPKDEIAKWMAATCDCDNCKARRGEL